MARGYSMATRAATAASTRERIVDAARELLLAGDFAAVTMDEVARRAGVARATVYQHVSSKVGLVGAVVDDGEDRSGVTGLAGTVDAAAAGDLVRTVVKAWTRRWATDPEVTRTAQALARLQPELHELLGRHDASRLAVPDHRGGPAG